MALQCLEVVLEVVEEEKHDTLQKAMSPRHCRSQSLFRYVGETLKVDVAP